MENSMLLPRYCPICRKEIEYDGTCGCPVNEEDDDDLYDNEIGRT